MFLNFFFRFEEKHMYQDTLKEKMVNLFVLIDSVSSAVQMLSKTIYAFLYSA